MGGQFDRTRNLKASQEALLVVTPAEAGVQKTLEKLDSRVRGNDRKRRLLILSGAASLIQEFSSQKKNLNKPRTTYYVEQPRVNA